LCSLFTLKPVLYALKDGVPFRKIKKVSAPKQQRRSRQLIALMIHLSFHLTLPLRRNETEE
jgi:hypothetical protein